MYPTININGQRINLNNIAGFAPCERNNDVIFDLNGGMEEDESPYIVVRLNSKDEQTQLVNLLDQKMKVIHFVPIID